VSIKYKSINQTIATPSKHPNHLTV